MQAALTARRFGLAVGLLALIGSLIVGYLLWWTPLRDVPTAIGQKAPEFDLPDEAGNRVTLSSLLETGPALLLFYRGYW